MFKTLLNADLVEMEQDMENSQRDMEFFMKHPHLYSIYDWLNLSWHQLMYATVCRKGKNCDIRVEGYADGDSGYEDWWCTRCGRNGRHIYY